MGECQAGRWRFGFCRSSVRKPVDGRHQRAVVVTKAEVAAAFVVVKAKLALELLVVELDLPPQAGEAGEPLGLGVGGEVREPVIGRLILALGPFDDQPFLPSRGRIASPTRARHGRAENRTAISSACRPVRRGTSPS